VPKRVSLSLGADVNDLRVKDPGVGTVAPDIVPSHDNEPQLIEQPRE